MTSAKEKVIGYTIAFCALMALVLAFNFIPWLLWNKAIAPLFGWRQFTFWQIFFIAWGISLLGSLLRGGKK